MTWPDTLPMVLALFITVLTSYVLYIFFKRGTKGKNSPPGPILLPLLGHLHLLRDNHIQRNLYKLSQIYGPVMSICFSSKPVIIISSIEAATEFLVTKGKVFAGRPQTKTTRAVNPTQGGLVSADYTQVWRDNRKHMHRFINCNGTNSDLLTRLIEEETDKLMDLFEKSHGEAIQIWDQTFCFAFNIIHRLLYSSTIDIDSEKFKSYTNDFKLINQLIRKPLRQRLWEKFFPPKSHNPIIDISKRIYQETKEQIIIHEKTQQEDVVRDWLDTVVADSNSRVSLVSQACPVAMDTILAAIDSTKNTIMWGVLYLCHYKEMQQQLQEAVDNQSRDKCDITCNQQGTIPYLEAFINEVLRHSCVSSFGQPHKAMGDSDIQGYFVKAGQLVMVNTYGIHYDKRFWRQPEEFRPERFIDSNGKVYIPNESFMPFSSGTRSCIGEGLARLELFTVFANILKHFTVSFPKGHCGTFEGQRELSWAPKEYSVVIETRK